MKQMDLAFRAFKFIKSKLFVFICLVFLVSFFIIICMVVLGFKVLGKLRKQRKKADIIGRKDRNFNHEFYIETIDKETNGSLKRNCY